MYMYVRINMPVLRSQSGHLLNKAKFTFRYTLSNTGILYGFGYIHGELIMAN